MSKELLTELLDGIEVFHSFLTVDLIAERLSPGNEQKRLKNAELITILKKKICSSHLSVRPRINTPSSLDHKPPPPPPVTMAPVGMASKPPPPLPIEPEEEDQEMYVECEPCDRLEGEVGEEDGEGVPQDYLTFEPSQGSGSPDMEGPTELYEAMNPGEDPQEMYEEPVIPPSISTSSRSSSQQSDHISADIYEEPIVHIPGGPPNFKPPTPTSSRENSGSGAVYMETQRVRQSVMMDEVPLSWEYDLTAPKGEKTKPGDLSEILIKGPLEKLGGRSKNTWQKRYCVLSGAFMYFYEKESSKTFNNRIALPNYVVGTAPHLSNDKKKQFAFKLTHTDSTGNQKDYYFRASSDDTRTKWVGALNRTLKRLSMSASPPQPRVAATLPRTMPSHLQPMATLVTPTFQKPRASSVGADETGEVYEDINRIDEEEEEAQDEYIAVNPANEEDDPEEEYVDVVPGQHGDIEQEEYEAPNFDLLPTTFMPPPPTTAPPPSFSSAPPVQALPPRQPAPRPVQPAVETNQPPVPSPPVSHHPIPQKYKPVVNTNKPPTQPPPVSLHPAPQPIKAVVDMSKVYIQGHNGIHFEHVFVALWDFRPQEKDELNLRRGDLVYVKQPSRGSEWWYGEVMNDDASSTLGRVGFFPSTYSTAAFEAVS